MTQAVDELGSHLERQLNAIHQRGPKPWPLIAPA
jgi:hypothetical protein